MLHRVGTALAVGLLLASSFATGITSALAADAVGTSQHAVQAVGAPPTEQVRQRSVLNTYAGGSTVVEEALYSPTLGLHTSYRVMLPPNYDATARNYPTLYMLHGVAGDSSEWQSIGILEAADRMIQRGEVDPFIIVLPNGGAHYWVNQYSGQRWADYVVNDVVSQVDQQYRTVAAPQARAIGGLSMGGEGALRLALTNPETFGIAAAHSPSLRTAFDQFAPELEPIFGNEEYWRSVTPLWLVMDTDTAYQLTIALDIGEDDPWRQNVELLHERMTVRGISHRFDVLPGEHAAEYWIDNVERYVGFYGTAFPTSAELEVVSDAS
jgi:enterochelin esterase-like enzyme